VIILFGRFFSTFHFHPRLHLVFELWKTGPLAVVRFYGLPATQIFPWTLLIKPRLIYSYVWLAAWRLFVRYPTEQFVRCSGHLACDLPSLTFGLNQPSTLGQSLLLFWFCSAASCLMCFLSPQQTWNFHGGLFNLLN
jgi:hypothetical protein